MAERDQEKIKNEIEECKKQTADYLAGWQRAKADLINYKKEIAEEKNDWIMFGKKDLILKIIKVLDHWQEAENHLDENLKKNEWVKGVLNITKELESVLKHEGLEAFGNIGDKFNPEFYESVGVEKSHQKQNEVSKILQKGYLYNKKLLRPAKVVLAE